jgi:hypothetical protein
MRFSELPRARTTPVPAHELGSGRTGQRLVLGYGVSDLKEDNEHDKGGAH